MIKLFIIYIAGRWGPEKILGYIVAEDAGCIRETTYKTWDIIGEAEADLKQQIALYHKTRKAVCVTNPLGIVNTQDYRKWQRRQRKKR